MKELPSITVIIPTSGERSKLVLDKAVSCWRKQPVDAVWIAANKGVDAVFSQNAPGAAPVFFWSAPVDVKTKFDYALAAMAETDFVICADDDMFPQPGFTEDLLAYRNKGQDGQEMFGVIGRRFTDATYTKCPWFGAKAVGARVAVDFLGVCFAAHQSMFGFNMRGMPRNADDLWICMKVHPHVNKWVVPTTNFENAPVKGMFHDGQLKMQRQKFYERHVWDMIRHPHEPLSEAEAEAEAEAEIEYKSDET